MLLDAGVTGDKNSEPKGSVPSEGPIFVRDFVTIPNGSSVLADLESFIEGKG